MSDFQEDSSLDLKKLNHWGGLKQRRKARRKVYLSFSFTWHARGEYTFKEKKNPTLRFRGNKLWNPHTTPAKRITDRCEKQEWGRGARGTGDHELRMGCELGQA